MTKHSRPPPSIRDLYPQLTLQEQAIAEENIERYLQLILRINKRIENGSARKNAKVANDAEDNI